MVRQIQMESPSYYAYVSAEPPQSPASDCSPIGISPEFFPAVTRLNEERQPSSPDSEWSLTRTSYGSDWTLFLRRMMIALVLPFDYRYREPSEDLHEVLLVASKICQLRTLFCIDDFLTVFFQEVSCFSMLWQRFYRRCC